MQLLSLIAVYMCRVRGPQAPTPHGMVPPPGAQTSAFHQFFQGVGVLGGSEHKVAAISASQGCSGPQAPSNWGMHMHAYARICMHMHAKACICIACICMHMHTYACICMHMHAYACICMHLHAHAYICMHMHTHADACTCMHMHAYVCMCMHMYA